MPQDTVLHVSSPGVLANDADPGGHALRISSIIQPASGTLSPSLLGGFTFTSNPGFSDSDSFQFRASDNHLVSNLVSVLITVTPTASAPEAVPVPVLNRLGMLIMLLLFLAAGLHGRWR